MSDQPAALTIATFDDVARAGIVRVSCRDEVDNRSEIAHSRRTVGT